MLGLWGVVPGLIGLLVLGGVSNERAPAHVVPPCCMKKGVARRARSNPSSSSPDDERPACDGPYGLPGSSLPPDQIGAWGPVEPFPTRSTHAILLHTGRILFWWESAELYGLPTTTYVWDPGTDQIDSMLTPATEI